MTVGFLSLLQRELRDAVIHPFNSVAGLIAHDGVDGQVASVDGNFYVYTDRTWKRILNEDDLSLIMVAIDSNASVFKTVITSQFSEDGVFHVAHGFRERPIVTVSGPNGDDMIVKVVYSDISQSCDVRWAKKLATPATVTCVGSSVSSG